MSHFSSVDDSPSPSSLVDYLDKAAAGLTAMKNYVAAAAARAVGDGLVLDIGCGAGHDLALLAAAGVDAIGVDTSAAMLATARSLLASTTAKLRLVGGEGASLPFRDGSAAGCRVERVLIHVDSPEAVFAELSRVTAAGGFLAVFEPDWSTLQLGTGDPEDDALARSLAGVRHPDIGGRLPNFIAAHGFRLLDCVREKSFAYRINDFPINFERQLAKAATAGRIDTGVASNWLARQEAIDRAGRFRAAWTKVLVVAERKQSAL